MDKNIWSLIFERPNRREREGKRKREKKRKRKRRRREEEVKQSKKGMELTLGMNFSMDHMDFVWNSRKVYKFQT